jgi:hypothetical protein
MDEIRSVDTGTKVTLQRIPTILAQEPTVTPTNESTPLLKLLQPAPPTVKPKKAAKTKQGMSKAQRFAITHAEKHNVPEHTKLQHKLVFAPTGDVCVKRADVRPTVL